NICTTGLVFQQGKDAPKLPACWRNIRGNPSGSSTSKRRKGFVSLDNVNKRAFSLFQNIPLLGSNIFEGCMYSKCSKLGEASRICMKSLSGNSTPGRIRSNAIFLAPPERLFIQILEASPSLEHLEYMHPSNMLLPSNGIFWNKLKALLLTLSSETNPFRRLEVDDPERFPRMFLQHAGSFGASLPCWNTNPVVQRCHIDTQYAQAEDSATVLC
ncbi:hypothetical protein E4U45_008313, partial [Claviceps purpurea]